MADRPLTIKQRLFVEAYLANPNATRAAIKAGYSAKTAASQGERLLRNVEIRALVEKRVESFGKTADDVLKELGKMAFGSHRTYRSDKVKSLELIGKHFKLFTDKVESTGKDGGPIQHEITKIELIDE